VRERVGPACAAAVAGRRGATRVALSKALESEPPVLHLATHVVGGRRNPVQGLVALSLCRREPDFLTAADIASWRVKWGWWCLALAARLGETLRAPA